MVHHPPSQKIWESIFWPLTYANDRLLALGDQALSTKHRIMQMTVPDRNDPARRVFVTLEYLEEQAKGQELYYMNYKKPREHDHDIIFELLQTEKRLSVAIPLRRAHRTGRLGFHIQEQLLAEARVNPLDLESLSHTAEGGVVAATLSSLMEKTNTAQEDWAQDGELYQRCQRSVALKKIRRIKAQVIQVITDRSIEVISSTAAPEAISRRRRSLHG
ncbi:hypothetical protein BDD12DRAFT_810392 [Trichophaea hybrida]|nr:hypothetical protein BDD12DRAFT_810392 [Trichophaea hybrida]